MKLTLTCLVLFCSCIFCNASKQELQSKRPDPSKGKCLTCHKEKTPGLYNQWFSSNHALHNVTCYDCHSARKEEPDAFLHEGFWIATPVTPIDCSGCHQKEVEEFLGSAHARAANLEGTTEAFLGHVAGGTPAFRTGCESCHGSQLVIDERSPNKLAPGSWPNSGIGRLNPDGSTGSCNACHSRHRFSREQARRPETCARCHRGPGHPQREVYEESKHGISYFSNLDKMNLEADRWIVGVDYFVAPTCASCHMSATATHPVTHDAGTRLSWDLGARVSQLRKDWKSKRAAMRDVCKTCHGPVFVDGFYFQLDSFVALYNEKFARPATRIMELIRSATTEVSFSKELDWIYWEMLHFDGSYARSGAAMVSPEDAWWRGIYPLSRKFYQEFLPAVRTSGVREAVEFVDSLLTRDPLHQWINKSEQEVRKDLESGHFEELYKILGNTGKTNH